MRLCDLYQQSTHMSSACHADALSDGCNAEPPHGMLALLSILGLMLGLTQPSLLLCWGRRGCRGKHRRGGGRGRVGTGSPSLDSAKLHALVVKERAAGGGGGGVGWGVNKFMFDCWRLDFHCSSESISVEASDRSKL